METIPDGVLDRLTGMDGSELTACAATPLGGGLGVATAGVARLDAAYRAGRAEGTFSVIRKTFRPVSSGRHAEAARDPRHWAFWRREVLAYASGVLPSGPGLRAPVCFGHGDDVVYLEDVEGTTESPVLAAARLGRWQAAAAAPSAPWLSGHQLAQRVAAGGLDWSAVDADPRMPALWERRAELLEALAGLPQVLSHGDFHHANIIATAGDTVVLDWGTLGLAPTGADLAHYLLGHPDGTDPAHVADLVDAYLDGSRGRFTRADAQTGLCATAALTGASRVHWRLAQGLPVPDGYVDLVSAMAP
ncbi:aminoglycoside phosphotransferase family protein [Phytomonospora sp. NPDC050363]|uniref:phosphotransferase family protein n=1 Tax=Phytomonospora sp. NPDC050363 TaxID=3155642 RepID=UPI0033C1BA3B